MSIRNTITSESRQILGSDFIRETMKQCCVSRVSVVFLHCTCDNPVYDASVISGAQVRNTFASLPLIDFADPVQNGFFS